MMRRVLAALLVTCAVLVVVVRAQNPTGTPATKPDDAALDAAKKIEQELKEAQIKQAKLEAQFKDFSSALRRLKQRLEQSPKAEDRQRAAELGKALELAEKENVTTKFEKLVESLKASKTTDPDALEAIHGKNKELEADIRAILSALTARNPDEELRKEKERIQELLKRLNELIRTQQTVRAWTERGMDKDPLGKHQQDVTDATKQFAKGLSKDGNDPKNNEQAKSNPKGEGVKKDGGAKAEGKDDTKENKGGGKDQEGKPGEKKPGDGEKKPGDGEKKPGDGDSKGEGKPMDGGDKKENPGGSKGEGKPMDGQDSKSGGKGENKPMEGENKGGSKGGDPKDGNQENKGGSKGNGGEEKKPGNQDPKDGKPGEGKGEPKPGNPMGGGDPKENKGGSKGDGAQGKPMGDQKPGDSKGGEGKPDGMKPGDSKGGQGGESKGKGEGKGEGKGQQGQQSPMNPMNPMGQKDQKPGDSKGGQGGMGQPSQGQGQSKGGGGGGGESQPQPPQPPQPPKDGYPGRKQVEDAQKSMEEAKKKIEEEKNNDAGKNQDKAIEDLKAAQKKLEELLRQLREEEIERMLAALQARCERMLAMQKEVYVGTVDTYKVVEAHADKKPTRAETIRSIGLADRESEIVAEANKAIILLEQEGTAVAFAEVFTQVRGDMMNVEKRLRTTDVGLITQTIEKDIIDSLGEMIEALKKAQKDQQAKKQQQQQGNPQNGPKPNDPLLDLIAELKMVRSMQLRVNNRTKTYGQEYPGLEQTPALDPTLPVEQKAKLEQIHKEFTDLSDRQEKIVDIVKNLSKGKGPER